MVARFPNTSWILLEEACVPGDQGKAAREEIANRYREPVRAFVGAVLARVGRSPVEADDLTNEFLGLSDDLRRVLAAADPARGRFRSLLKTALHHYVIAWLRKEGRRPRTRPLFDDDGSVVDEVSRLPNPAPGPEELVARAEIRAFDESWVRSLAKRATERVEALCEAKGQQKYFEMFVGYYLHGSPVRPSWKELGAPFGLDERAACERARTVARRFRYELRKILIEEEGSEEKADEELAELMSLL
jgi:RNA polymerase sigma-70 factor (ECF subfamily)